KSRNGHVCEIHFQMSPEGGSHSGASGTERLPIRSTPLMTDRPRPDAAPRQTLGYLRNLFQSRGIRPKNKLGQNFLIDLNLLEVILRAAELTKQDVVLEVGSGTGSLTARLAEQAGAVLSVEIDADFVKLADRAVAGRKNVTLLHADILKDRNQLNSGVLARLHELLAVH